MTDENKQAVEGILRELTKEKAFIGTDRILDWNEDARAWCVYDLEQNILFATINPHTAASFLVEEETAEVINMICNAKAEVKDCCSSGECSKKEECCGLHKSEKE